MFYKLAEILTKMGAPEVQEKNRIEWCYFDKKSKGLAGYAKVNLEAGGQRLVADLRHSRENYEDDHGKIHEKFEETFHLVAERAGPNIYKISSVSFDGKDYVDPPSAVTELALSIFHARALDISILMVEQTFNKQDITEPEHDIETELPPFGRRAIFSRLDNVPRRADFGIVIPFRPRVHNHSVAANAR
jgi:hypothetical protein